MRRRLQRLYSGMGFLAVVCPCVLCLSLGVLLNGLLPTLAQTAPSLPPKTEQAPPQDSDEVPASSRQNSDAPLQAAPVIDKTPDSVSPQLAAESKKDSPKVLSKDSPGTAADKPAPRTSKVQPSTPTGFRLFGTVEFKGPLKNIASWLSVLQRNAKDPIFQPEKKLGTTRWKDFNAKLEAMKPMEQLQAVNRFWNQWPYRQDTEIYKKQDYWATPAEFLKNSGDCEDYAITKYFTLKELGFDTAQMRIVVLMETIRNIAHAVLVVYIDNEAYVLDNLSNTVLSHSRYKNYLPQFSVNEHFRWAHVRPQK